MLFSLIIKEPLLCLIWINQPVQMYGSLRPISKLAGLLSEEYWRENKIQTFAKQCCSKALRKQLFVFSPAVWENPFNNARVLCNSFNLRWRFMLMPKANEFRDCLFIIHEILRSCCAMLLGTICLHYLKHLRQNWGQSCVKLQLRLILGRIS